jgi:hypothetical protein
VRRFAHHADPLVNALKKKTLQLSRSFAAIVGPDVAVPPYDAWLIALAGGMVGDGIGLRQ